MGLVVVVEAGQDVLEVSQDLVVPGHVRGQDAPDHALAHQLEVLAAERLEDVAVVVLQYPEGHAAVVVLQGRDVIVAYRQFRFGVDLVDVVVTRMVEVVADARGQQDEDLEVAYLGGEVHTPRYCVHLKGF